MYGRGVGWVHRVHSAHIDVSRPGEGRTRVPALGGAGPDNPEDETDDDDGERRVKECWVPVYEQLLSRNVERFRGGLVLEAHRLLYRSILGSRVVKQRQRNAGHLPHSCERPFKRVPATLHRTQSIN